MKKKKIDPKQEKLISELILFCEEIMNYFKEIIKTKHNSNYEQKFK